MRPFTTRTSWPLCSRTWTTRMLSLSSLTTAVIVVVDYTLGLNHGQGLASPSLAPSVSLCMSSSLVPMNRVPSSSTITTNAAVNSNSSPNSNMNTTRDGNRGREREKSQFRDRSPSLRRHLATQDADAKRQRASLIEPKERAMSREVGISQML